MTAATDSVWKGYRLFLSSFVSLGQLQIICSKQYSWGLYVFILIHVYYWKAEDCTLSFFAMIVDGLQINEPFNFDIIKIDTKTL